MPRSVLQKEAFTIATSISHIEWPTTLDSDGRLRIKNIPAEVQNALADLHKRQLTAINSAAAEHDEIVEHVTHVVTVVDENPDGSIEQGPFLLIESHVAVR